MMDAKEARDLLESRCRGRQTVTIDGVKYVPEGAALEAIHFAFERGQVDLMKQVRGEK
jgi:hypothetical protein